MTTTPTKGSIPSASKNLCATSICDLCRTIRSPRALAPGFPYAPVKGCTTSTAALLESHVMGRCIGTGELPASLRQCPRARKVVSSLAAFYECLLERDLGNRRNRNGHDRPDDPEDRGAEHEGDEDGQRRDLHFLRHHSRRDEKVLELLQQHGHQEHGPELPSRLQNGNRQRRCRPEDRSDHGHHLPEG